MDSKTFELIMGIIIGIMGVLCCIAFPIMLWKASRSPEKTSKEVVEHL